MIRVSSLALGALLLVAPAQAQTATEVFPTINSPTIFQEFGGLPGLRALMQDFEEELIRNPTTRPFFANRDNTRTKAQLVDQICQILGGGCVYTGATMRDSHRDMGVNQAHFFALVEALQIAMDRRGIPFRAQNRLLAVLAPMSRDIITR
jgi:hemoglobin